MKCIKVFQQKPDIYTDSFSFNPREQVKQLKKVCDVHKNIGIEFHLVYDVVTRHPIIYVQLYAEMMKQKTYYRVLEEYYKDCQTSCQIIIDCIKFRVDSNNNPELSSLRINVWEKLNLQNKLAQVNDIKSSLLRNMHIRKLIDYYQDDIFIMFGPWYNINSTRWLPEIAVWICFNDAMSRHFYKYPDEKRISGIEVNGTLIPIEYWYGKIDEQNTDLSECTWNYEDDDFNTYSDMWNGNKASKTKTCVGTRIGVIKDDGKKYAATLGPSLSSLYPKKFPDDLYITALHAFKNNYSDRHVISDTRVYCGKTFKEIGQLVTYSFDLNIAVLRMNYGTVMNPIKIRFEADPSESKIFNSPSRSMKSYFGGFDLMLQSKFTRLRSSFESVSPRKAILKTDVNINVEVSLNENYPTVDWKQYMFKSGCKTGLTKGKVLSWGLRIIPKTMSDTTKSPTHETHASIVCPLIYRDNDSVQQIGFSAKGDSGAPVFSIIENKARVIGIIEGVYEVQSYGYVVSDILKAFKFSIVTPLAEKDFIDNSKWPRDKRPGCLTNIKLNT